MPRRKTRTSFKKGNKARAGIKIDKPAALTLAQKEKIAQKTIDNGLVTFYFTLNSHLTPHELVRRLKTEKVSTLESMIIKGMLKAYRTGDSAQINFFLERLVGKVPNVLKHDVDNPYKDWTLEQMLFEKRRIAEINRIVIERAQVAEQALVEAEREVQAILEEKPNEPQTTD